ncbi:hypothetical protein JG687_00016669 [Phytophthora cactorum]|uniref:Uncharacterized protein n=1 Tax=Phytophthora cactorum TaxID=29920 RepID=A0A8T1TQ45_9STRA|nr:hypothetical protein JG687_00016669 [Phytophthora cactorum]
MGLSPVGTPSTGNCQVYAVPQALANSSFVKHTEQLGELTARLKQGCLVRALVDFDLKHDHLARKNTLLSLSRRRANMSRSVSDEEFPKYLQEYASSGFSHPRQCVGK